MSGFTREVRVYWDSAPGLPWTVEYDLPEDYWLLTIDDGDDYALLGVSYDEVVAAVLEKLPDDQVRADLLYDMARFEAYRKIL